MPDTFILRALLVDPDGTPLPEVNVRPFAVDRTTGSRTAIGAAQVTDGAGRVDLDITGSEVVQGPYLGGILLCDAVTDHVLAEQWSSFDPSAPTLLDFGEIRVWDAPIMELPGRTVVGVPAPFVAALGDSTELEAQLANVQGQLADTQGQLADTQGQLANVQGQLADTQGQLADTQGQLADTQGQLADTQGQLADSQSAYEEASSQIATLMAELEALNAQVGATSSLAAVVEGVGLQLRAAQQKMVASGSSFQLGKLSLSLKVVPTSSTSFGFATMEELASVGGEALSTVELDFAQTTAGAPEPPPEIFVPSLYGLTEPAARRQLATLGLGASVAHQAIADDGDVTLAGRVLKQAPAAGVPILPGESIMLVLGKALVSA